LAHHSHGRTVSILHVQCSSSRGNSAGLALSLPIALTPASGESCFTGGSFQLLRCSHVLHATALFRVFTDCRVGSSIEKYRTFITPRPHFRAQQHTRVHTQFTALVPEDKRKGRKKLSCLGMSQALTPCEFGAGRGI